MSLFSFPISLPFCLPCFPPSPSMTPSQPLMDGDFHRMMTDAPPHYDAAGSEPETISPTPVVGTSVEGGSAKKRSQANKTKLARESEAGSSSGAREGRSHKVQRATAPVYVERDSLSPSPWRVLEGISLLTRCLASSRGLQNFTRDVCSSTRQLPRRYRGACKRQGHCHLYRHRSHRC